MRGPGQRKRPHHPSSTPLSLQFFLLCNVEHAAHVARSFEAGPLILLESMAARAAYISNLSVGKDF